MASRHFDWLVSLQTRLILASVAILVLAIVVTSGVFVYRDRQEQRSDTLERIASVTKGFSVSTFVPGAQGRPLEVVQRIEGGVPVPVGAGVSEATLFSSEGIATSATDVLVDGETRKYFDTPAYRILLVNTDGQVVNDPAGSLAGVKLSYPVPGVVDEKRGYVTWSGDAGNATAGLTFLAPMNKADLVTASGLKAVAAIDSTSLTADWLATAPDLALSALVGLPLAMAAVVLVTRRITHPLRSLTSAVEAMSRGDFDQRVEVRGRDEVATLASSFTVMAGRVKERDTQLRNLIANVSHDLRTPLTSIQGYAEALADGVARPSDIDRVGRIIRDEARHASSLLANLLGLSEIESGEVVLRNAEYDIGELVERCLRRLEPRAKERGLELHLQSSTLPALFGDAEKVERAICNLLENAVKFARSRVDLTINASSGEARVAVRNDGPAIAHEDVERIFDRFYRSGGPNAGTGLGLAIARELAELNGGSVELASTGSPVEFVLSLPLS